MKEIWKDIKGYEGLYQVSNLGRIKSLLKFHKTSNFYSSIGYTSKEKILKLSANSKGYLIVNLCKDKKAKSFRVHRLVAETFIPNKENKLCINHIDGNKQNNDVNNLEWCTYSENMKHAYKNHLTDPKTPKRRLNTLKSLEKARKVRLSKYKKVEEWKQDYQEK